MKKIIHFAAIALILCSSASTLQAQEDISSIFKAGVADLNTVANGYLTPAGNSFATGLGTNWYNTAAVHKPFGFDLTIGGGLVEVPVAEQMFSLTGLTNLVPTNTSITQAPTFGGTGPGVELNLMQPQTLGDGTANPLYPGKITSFITPAGISKYMPTASVQFTIGLPFINDVSVRFIPTVNASGFNVSMWGVGIKHNFKQWIPVVKDLPFDASILLAYTKFDLKYGFPASARITPDMLVGSDLAYIPTNTDYSTQGMSISANAMTANIIVSKKLLFVTPYVGFGITKTSFNLTMAGNYPILGNPKTHEEVIGGTTYTVPDREAGTNKPIMNIDNIANPIQIAPTSEVMPNVTFGLRLKVLWVLSVHAQYTMQKYPTASAGFGISIR
ncbi:MAG: DUF6588 family protein [Paludibacter sp.]